MTGREDEVTIDRAKLGIEAEAFIRSSLGRYLIERAEMEIEQGYQALHMTSPTDTKKNIEARMAIQVPMDFLKWIKEAIDSGKLAQAELQEEEDVID